MAFSGEITIGDESFTEPGMNAHDGRSISESQLPKYFATDDYNMLVVAEKYQTGFDEPRLHTMFVDKGLKGVKAVQTLSRLNRVHPLKVDTYILDFANTADGIRDSFLPFYEDTLLGEAIDPNLVYKLKDSIEKFFLFNQADVDRFCALYLKKGTQTATDLGKLAGAVKPAVDAYNAMDVQRRMDARDAVRHFNRAYAYITQIVRMFDRDLHRTYLFTEALWRLLPPEGKEVVDLDGKVSLEKNRLAETFSGSIELAPKSEDKEFSPQDKPKSGRKPDKKELLERIVEKINLMYEGKFTEADRVIIEILYDRIARNSKALSRFAKTTDPEMFAQSIFPETFGKVAQECYNEQMYSFSKLFEDKAFYRNVMEQMARTMYQGMRNRPGA